MDLDYLDFVVVLHLPLEHLWDVLQLGHLWGDPVLVVLQQEYPLVDWAVVAALWVPCEIDWDGKAGNLLLNLLSLSSLLQLLYLIS